MTALDEMKSERVSDRSIKTEIYAQAGVPEYWIVDVRRRQVEVLTHPTRTGYARIVTRGSGELLRPTQLRRLAIPVADIPWTARTRKRR